MCDNRGQLIGHLNMLGKTELPSKKTSFNLGVYLPIPWGWRVTWLRNSGYE
jgi:hypothetical protein